MNAKARDGRATRRRAHARREDNRRPEGSELLSVLRKKRKATSVTSPPSNPPGEDPDEHGPHRTA